MAAAPTTGHLRSLVNGLRLEMREELEVLQTLRASLRNHNEHLAALSALLKERMALAAENDDKAQLTRSLAVLDQALSVGEQQAIQIAKMAQARQNLLNQVFEETNLTLAAKFGQ